MTFEELKNGMKDLFSSLGAKTSDSNYAVGLFDKTSAEPKGIMDFASLASVLGAPAYGNPIITLASNLTGSGTVNFLVGDSVNNRQGRNPIQLYSIWIWGQNVERMLLVAIINRYSWEKEVKELWNTTAGITSTCTISVTAKGGDSDGFTINYSITNGSTCELFAKKLNY